MQPAPATILPHKLQRSVSNGSLDLSLTQSRVRYRYNFICVLLMNFNFNVYFQVLRSLAYKDAKAVGDEWEPVVEGNKKVNNHIPPTCLVNIVCNLSFDYNLSG